MGQGPGGKGKDVKDSGMLEQALQKTEMK